MHEKDLSPTYVLSYSLLTVRVRPSIRASSLFLSVCPPAAVDRSSEKRQTVCEEGRKEERRSAAAAPCYTYVRPYGGDRQWCPRPKSHCAQAAPPRHATDSGGRLASDESPRLRSQLAADGRHTQMIWFLCSAAREHAVNVARVAGVTFGSL